MSARCSHGNCGRLYGKDKEAVHSGDEQMSRYIHIWGKAVAQLVEKLCYKKEGRGFHS